MGGVIELNVRTICGARSSDLASRYEVVRACIYGMHRIGMSLNVSVCVNVYV